MFDHKEVICKLEADRKNRVGVWESRGEVKHLTLLNIKYQGHYLQPSALID